MPYLCCGCSVAQSCPTLRDPMDCSTPGFPVLHYLLEFAQTHVHRVSEAIQPSHPLLPSSFVFNLIPASGSSLISRLFTISDGQNIVASVSASVLPMNIQGWFPLGFSGWSCCPRDSQESPSAQCNLKTCVRWWEYKSEQKKYWACSPGTYNPY